MLDVLSSEDAICLRFVGLKQCRLQDSDVVQIALSNPNLAMDLEGNHLGESVLDGLAAQGRLLSSDDMQGFDRWTQRLSGVTLASREHDMDDAKLAGANRPHGKQARASSIAMTATRAVRSALRFSWGRRNLMLGVN